MLTWSRVPLLVWEGTRSLLVFGVSLTQARKGSLEGGTGRPSGQAPGRV